MSRFLPRREPAPDAPESPAAVARSHSDASQRPTPGPAADITAPQPRSVAQETLVRFGIRSWALVGVLLLAVAAFFVMGQLRVVVVPLILALFPAAVLMPLNHWLQRHRLPPAAAAAILLIGTFALVSGLISLLAPTVAAELDGLTTSAQEGYEQVAAFLAEGPFGLEPILVEDLIERARAGLGQGDTNIGQRVFGVAGAVAEGLTGLVFGLFALFFYLKDGERIAGWLRDLFPRRVRGDVAAMSSRSWDTVGGYIRGQLFVAFIDAMFIGIGLLALRVPLAFPLAVLVFFGGLFPIVGAFASGTLAVLVALATQGVTKALIVLALVLLVQQIEGNLLQPIVLGKATALHPLAVIGSLTAGGLTLGILGAFLAVPVAASVARSVGYIREQRGAG